MSELKKSESHSTEISSENKSEKFLTLCEKARFYFDKVSGLTIDPDSPDFQKNIDEYDVYKILGKEGCEICICFFIANLPNPYTSTFKDFYENLYKKLPIFLDYFIRREYADGTMRSIINLRKLARLVKRPDVEDLFHRSGF